MTSERVVLVACCMALAAASTLAGWWIGSRNPFSLSPALAGAMFGLSIYVAAEIALRRARIRVLQALVLVLAGALAAYCAFATFTRGGTLRWINGSVVGALGLAAGLLLVLPQARHRRLILAMLVAGIAGGLVLSAGSELLYGAVRKRIGARTPEPMLLIWLWQAGLLSAAALALRSSKDTTP